MTNHVAIVVGSSLLVVSVIDKFAFPLSLVDFLASLSLLAWYQLSFAHCCSYFSCQQIALVMRPWIPATPALAKCFVAVLLLVVFHLICPDCQQLCHVGTRHVPFQNQDRLQRSLNSAQCSHLSLDKFYHCPTLYQSIQFFQLFSESEKNADFFSFSLWLS